MSGPLDDYLAQLERALPAPIRRRVLAEVEDHLRESAAVSGEDEALARFGSARDVARAFATAEAIRAVRRSTVFLLLALIPVGLMIYPLPHNLLPPWGSGPLADWPSGDFSGAGKQDAILFLLLATGVLAAGAGACAWSRLFPLALPFLAGGFASLLATTVVAALLAVQWHAATDAAPSIAWLAVYALAETLAGAAFAKSAARAMLVLLVAPETPPQFVRRPAP